MHFPPHPLSLFRPLVGNIVVTSCSQVVFLAFQDTLALTRGLVFFLAVSTVVALTTLLGSDIDRPLLGNPI